MLKAIMFAHENIKKICEFQEEFAKLYGKENIEFEKPEVLPLVKNFIQLVNFQEDLTKEKEDLQQMLH